MLLTHETFGRSAMGFRRSLRPDRAQSAQRGNARILRVKQHNKINRSGHNSVEEAKCLEKL
jgi:hypothetical protein